MTKLFAVLSIVISAALIQHQGWTALLWGPVGFAFGLFSTANVLLLPILGIPLAIKLVARKQMRPMVFAAIVVTPIIWFVALTLLAFLVGWCFPQFADSLYNNLALNLNANLGLAAILLSVFSKKQRTDFRTDFDKSYQRFYIGTVQYDQTRPDSGPDDRTEELIRLESQLAELTKMKEDLENISTIREALKDPVTVNSLGQMAYDGDGVPKDYAEAAKWYRMAAEQGYAKAQHNLALMHENGEGGPQDYVEAAKWYLLASQQGLAASQNNLAALYETGRGVPQSDSEAIKWYREGFKNGDENAVSNLNRLLCKVVFAYGDLMTANAPLIGDCQLLPCPKKAILYGIYWIKDQYEAKEEEAADETTRKEVRSMIDFLCYLLTRLARDWQEIDPGDREAIAKLAGLEAFPEWADNLRQKYIDDARGASEAAEMAFEVMRDKVLREKQERKGGEELQPDGEQTAAASGIPAAEP